MYLLDKLRIKYVQFKENHITKGELVEENKELKKTLIKYMGVNTDLIIKNNKLHSRVEVLANELRKSKKSKRATSKRRSATKSNGSP